MKTVHLSNGETRHLADLSLKTAIEEIKADFRSMPFYSALLKNREDIEYIIEKGYKKRGLMMRSLQETSSFAGQPFSDRSVFVMLKKEERVYSLIGYYNGKPVIKDIHTGEEQVVKESDIESL